jgi:hypothetical protein
VDHAVERASLLTEIPIVTEEGEHAFLSITHLDAEEADGGIQLLADGLVTCIDEDGTSPKDSPTYPSPLPGPPRSRWPCPPV